MQRGGEMAAPVPHTHGEDALPCCHLAGFHHVLLQTGASKLVLLGTGGAQPWTGPLAVAWQVILPNRICILAAAILGIKNESVEANCAYTDIARVQPFRTPARDRQSGA